VPRTSQLPSRQGRWPALRAAVIWCGATAAVVVAGWSGMYLLFRMLNHAANSAVGTPPDLGDPLTGGASSLFGGRPTVFELAATVGPPVIWLVAVTAAACLLAGNRRVARRSI
jgi:hypothetical protein